MPTVSFAEPRGNSPSEIADYIVGLRRDLNYYLMNLDTLNINRLDAKVIVARTITADKIGAGEITANEIAANTITANEIAAGTITANEIAANTITGDKIAANTITADKLNVNQLSAISVDAGELTAGIITGLTIRTAATGRRIELSGDKLSTLDSDTLDGFTLSGADGDMKYYTEGVQRGGIYKDTSLYEKIRISHDFGVDIASDGSTGIINLQAKTVSISNLTGNLNISSKTNFNSEVDFDGNSHVVFNGTVDFTNATIIGLSVSGRTTFAGDPAHDHGFSANVE